MRLSAVLATVFAVAVVQAQILTSTLPEEDGNTLIVSRTIDADGDTQIVTLSTVGIAGAGAGATAVPTRTTTHSSSHSSSSTKAATAAVSGATASIASGTQLDYSAWAAAVAPSLSAAYYATVSSSAAPATLAIPPLAVVAGLAALASVLA